MVAEQPPPVPYRVEPLLVDAALTMLFGQPGEGKSLLAAVLANAVANGDAVAGLAARQGRAVYIDAENGKWEIHRRVHTLGLSEQDLELYEADGFDLRRDISELAKIVADAKPQLLVLDSLASLTPGFKENDADQTSPVLDALRRLAHRSELAILLIHHARKDGETYRGNTGILASVDAAFRLARDKDDPDRARRFLSCHKMRVGPEPARRWLRLTVDRGQVFVDETDPHGEPDAAPVAPAQTELRPRVVAELGHEPRSRKAIARAVGRSEDDQTVRRVLHTLELDGLARHTTGGWLSGGSGVTPYRG